MKVSSNTKRVLAVTAVSLVFAAIRTYIVKSNYVFSATDTKEYFLPKSDVGMVYGAIFFLVCAAFVALGVFAGKKRTAVSEQSGVLSGVPVVLVFVATVAFAAKAIMDALASDEYIISPTVQTLLASRGVFVAVFGVLSGLLSVVAWYKAYRGGEDGKISALPMFMTVFCGLRLLFTFMLHSSTPNINSGNYNILSLSALLLFFLCEGKACIKKGSAALYISFGYIAIMTTAAYMIPDIVFRVSGKLPFGLEGFGSVLSAAMALFVIIRLAAMPDKLSELEKDSKMAPPKEVSGEVKVIRSVPKPESSEETENGDVTVAFDE